MKNYTKQPRLLILFAAGLLLPGFNSHAEEGGTGHYTPGATASFVDATPLSPAFIIRFNGLFYDGSISRGLPIAGLGPLNVEAESYAAALTVAWRPKIDLWEGWSYAASVTIPYVWANVEGDLTFEGRSARRSSVVSGIGDLVVVPAMVNYALSPDLHVDARCLVYAPTGEYEVGRMANTSKNFWTIEPTLGLLYFGRKNRVEASIYGGLDFNTRNEDTDYLSGTQFHVDATLAQHFPLSGGLAGIGVNGFWYQQVTGDSGPGAKFGDFKGRTAGIGPVLSYTHNLAGQDFIAELKWLPELETKNRLIGDYLWLRVIVKY